MSHHIVEAVNLHYTYPEGTVGLEGISFRIEHGESVAIVGENGAGKSTLLLHLNGCLTAAMGSVRIGEHAITKKNINAVRRSVGMVFQNPDDQLFMPTVFDDVAFGPLNLGYTKQEAEAKVNEALDTVRMRHLSRRPPYKLSQGEKRSVAIAAVLAMSPDILVMDEPTSSLDPLSRRELINLLKQFQHTKIIATHDLDMVMDICRRTIVLHKGKITADGPTKDILRDSELLHRSKLEKPLSMQACPACGAPKRS
ncbi:MAG: energy-coupling factor ABC transporter ATP-binding protein [Candidatus Omnitrophica bacterium]|nr:energy-coupling factor ABC transporter ATP-binding protein [Candidatus Omnitrophota bacterium]